MGKRRDRGGDSDEISQPGSDPAVYRMMTVGGKIEEGRDADESGNRDSGGEFGTAGGGGLGKTEQ